MSDAAHHYVEIGGATLEMQSALADPYPEAMAQVRSSLQNVQGMHEEWKRLLRSENTALSERFQHLHAEIAGEMQGLDEDLEGISSAIKVVEINRKIFPLEDAELSRRRDFHRTSLAALRDVRENVQSQQVSSKMDADRREATAARAAAPSVGAQGRRSDSAERMATEDFLIDQRLEQQRIVAQQEDYMVDIGKSAERMKDMAGSINREIQHHNELLEDLHDDVDKETEKLNVVMKNVGRLLQTSDRTQLYVIIALSVLFLILLFFVVA